MDSGNSKGPAIRVQYMRLFAACAAMASVVLPSSAQEFAAKVEIQPIQTMALSSTEFLLGKKDGAPVLIAGELRLPKAGDSRFPAVILVHGAGGVDARHEAWARELNGIGIATFILDAFTGRGIANAANEVNRLSALTMLQDAYRALEYLSKHPRIDPNRIAIMGFSKGAIAGLFASMRRFQQAYQAPGTKFAAYIAFYATCNIKYIGYEDVSNEPIRLYHGTADTWVPVAPCRDYVSRLRAAGHDIELTEYAGAHHAFDDLAISTPITLPQAQSLRNCRLEEKPLGTTINADTGQVFGPKDPCLERGVMVGYDPAATAAARLSVKEFLTNTFHLTH